MIKKTFAASLILCGLILFLVVPGFAKKAVPEPKEVLGFVPGDDYKLASWASIVEYFKKLDASSDRVILKEAGKTTEGKPFVYALISSPENLKRIDYYRGINDKLADPRLINRSDKKAEMLIKQGKTFVAITHGIHSTEVGSTLSSTLTAHRLASSDEPDIKKILDETIIVMVPSLNPDGVDIVKNWYDKTLGTKFEGTRPPELYQKYVGHDNNRDWYAFTQVETQLTVKHIHNQFHPQIVHDIHQQGSNGARFFVPPYLNPVEPNVPKEIIEGYSEIGNYIAGQMRKAGMNGITTGSTYDAWTPARAYSHYHGGARILSETASARLASPITVDYKKMTSRRGFDVFKVSENYSPLWTGGEWGMRDITNYMTTGAFYLMKHAAENREKWLKRFYRIGKDATQKREKGKLFAYVLPLTRDKNGNYSAEFYRANGLQEKLRLGGVQVHTAEFDFTVNGVKYKAGSFVIPMAQPYGGFAKAMLENGGYPNLIDKEGNPIPPYDVTSHSLSLLMGVTAMPIFEPVTYRKKFKTGGGFGRGSNCGCGSKVRFGLFRSSIPSKDEGWTRWVLKNYGKATSVCCFEFEPIRETEARSQILTGTRGIIFPDQSPNQILNGYREGRMPKEYTGGLKGKGVENLKQYVAGGGTLVFLNRSSDFAIEQFNLPVKNIAKDWKRKDFFIPGSILRTELDKSHPITKGMPEKSIAWFERSPVFESTDDSRVKVIGKYPSDSDKILLSGWALGKEKIAGKAALVEVKMGKGKIILFGFRPQYRGQSLATFPLLFNSVSN
ncbi:MAG: hypothetical protein HKN25_14750 [Pyrinomonadaceae bacterium]|nr:hypothetical protein [Pyrinomonadaceae bacterium]